MFIIGYSFINKINDFNRLSQQLDENEEIYNYIQKNGDNSLLDELKSKKAKGKKIDFILLEMLREINTTLAKVAFSDEKKHGLNVKILIEEMREQVSNVE